MKGKQQNERDKQRSALYRPAALYGVCYRRGFVHPFAFLVPNPSLSPRPAHGRCPSVRLSYCYPPGPSLPPAPCPALTPQPYFNLTWRNPEHVAKWANGTWVYTRRFDPLDPCLKLNNADAAAASTSGSGIGSGSGTGSSTGSSNGSGSGSGSGSSSRPSCDVFLVFDGVKMGARIALNGHVLGEITDQFLRYRYSVGHLLHFNTNGNNNNNHVKTNTLTVTFDRTIDTGGRFMACTGGYDWGPWSTTWKTSESVDAVNNSYDARFTAKGYVRWGGRGGGYTVLQVLPSNY